MASATSALAETSTRATMPAVWSSCSSRDCSKHARPDTADCLCAPGQRQVLCAEDEKALDRLQRYIGDLPCAGQAIEHSVERDFHLQTRQGSAQAEVDATPEAQVSVRLALDVEAISIRELGLITIRRADPGNDRLASFDLLIADGRLGGCEARHGPDRRVVAQRLFDRARHEGAIGAQTFHGAVILIQAEEQIADQVGRGFVARD